MCNLPRGLLLSVCVFLYVQLEGNQLWPCGEGFACVLPTHTCVCTSTGGCVCVHVADGLTGSVTQHNILWSEW